MGPLLGVVACGAAFGSRETELFAQVPQRQIPLPHASIESGQPSVSGEKVGLEQESLIEGGRRLHFTQPSQKRQPVGSRPDALASIAGHPPVGFSQNQVRGSVVRVGVQGALGPRIAISNSSGGASSWDRK